MKCQNLFSGKNKKNMANFSSAEFSLKVVVNILILKFEQVSLTALNVAANCWMNVKQCRP